jgi:hypothetical protein
MGGTVSSVGIVAMSQVWFFKLNAKAVVQARSTHDTGSRRNRMKFIAMEMYSGTWYLKSVKMKLWEN